MNSWQILGRFRANPPPTDWQQALAERLGQRPRRIGRWAELALYGALQCLDSAGEARLPENARLGISSVHGPDLALRRSLAEAQSELPMPIGFLQSQPSQLLPTLAQYLQWQGDGRITSTRNPLLALLTTLEEQGVEDVLFGWVSEDGEGETAWLRLQAVQTPAECVCPTSFADLWSKDVHFVSLPTAGKRPTAAPG